jgi:hypothetical protein
MLVEFQNAVGEELVATVNLSNLPRNGEYVLVGEDRWVVTGVDYHLTAKLHFFQTVVIWVAKR